jgi:predicted phosphodiesterase
MKDSAYVFSFCTPGAEKCRLSFRIEGSLGVNWQEENDATVTHIFVLSGLPPEKTISYKIETAASVKEGNFRTSRSVFPIRLLIYSDSRWDHSIHRRLLQNARNLEFDFYVNLGDVVTEPDDAEEWDRFHGIIATESEKKPYQFVFGNHDWPIPSLPTILPGLPKEGYYSFTVGKTKWIVLNTNKTIASNTAQGEFLYKELLDARENDYIPILVTHHPIYSAGPHGQENMVRKLRDFILPYIQEFNIPLVISGHDHAYQKVVIGKTLYLVTAGGGAATYQQKYDQEGLVCYLPIHHFVYVSLDEEGIQGTAYDIDHRIIDTFFFPYR